MGSAVVGLAVVRMRYILASTIELFNTLHVQGWDGTDPIPNTAAAMLGLATTVNTALGGAGDRMEALLSSAQIIDSVAVEDLSPAGIATQTVVNGNGCDDSGQPTDPETCLVVTLETGFAGRDNRGRLYTGVHAAARLSSVGTLWDSDHATNVGEAIQHVLDAITSDSFGWRPVLYHRHATQHHSADTVTEILTARGRTTPGRQRRRRVGIGS